MGFFFNYIGKLRKQTLHLILGSLLLSIFAGPVSAIKDQDCLDCHRDLMLKTISSTGELRSIYVDPQEWVEDIHHKKGIKCVDCHEGMTPFSHPKEGARRVGCTRCHPGASEENQLNIHNAFAGITDKSLPECYDCHTKHRVRAKRDAESTVRGENVGKTCYSCHENIRRKGYINFLPTRIFLGHRKCDVDVKFNIKACINCHGDAGHGPMTTYPEYCGRCHNTMEKGDFFSATHASSSSQSQPFRFLMGNMSLGLNLALIIGALIGLIIYLTRSYRMRKEVDSDNQRKDI